MTPTSSPLKAAAALALYWQEKAGALAATSRDAAPPERFAAPPERFAALVTSGVCASAVIYNKDGSVAYPAEGGAAGPPERPGCPRAAGPPEPAEVSG